MAEKKGLIYRLTMGKDNLPDFTPDKLPGTRFQVFKDVFFNRLGAMVKINLLVLLFALPAIAWVVIMNMVKQVDCTIIPYSGNIGMGFSVVSYAAAAGESRVFMFNMIMYAGLIPCIMVGSIGLSGAFYVMRRLVWGEGISVFGHFFRGIKANFLPFLWSSLITSVSLFLVMSNFSIYNQMTEWHVAWRVIGIAMSIIQFVLVLCMMIFLTTQAVTYKLKTWALVKNSFLFAIALIPQNIIIIILSALPIIIMLLLPQMISMFGLMIFAIIGFSYIILLWTVYAHWAFDKFINDRVEGAVKNKGMYKRTESDKVAAEERDRKNKNIRFNNPKKRSKKITSIDEGETYTPLPTSFSRADLERLATEKEQVKRAIDAEYEDDGSDDAGADGADTVTAENTDGADEKR